MTEDSPDTQNVVAYLDGLVMTLRGSLASATETGDVEAIHHARVCTRRLRAAVDVLAPLLPSKPVKRLKRVLKRFRRRLGPLRDLDVMIERLQERSESTPAGEWFLRICRERRVQSLVEAQGDRALAKSTEKMADWPRLRDEIARHHLAIDTLLAGTLHQQMEAFAKCADAVEASGDDVDPHAVRIAGKSLRYALELAVEQGHPLPDEVGKLFKKLQDALGNWHDFVVLVEQCMQASVDGLVAHHNSGLQRSVLDLAGNFLGDADTQLSKFRRLWEENGGAISDAIRQTFPLSAAADAKVTESKTDRDPPGLETLQVPDVQP